MFPTTLLLISSLPSVYLRTVSTVRLTNCQIVQLIMQTIFTASSTSRLSLQLKYSWTCSSLVLRLRKPLVFQLLPPRCLLLIHNIFRFYIRSPLDSSLGQRQFYIRFRVQFDIWKEFSQPITTSLINPLPWLHRGSFDHSTHSVLLIKTVNLFLALACVLLGLQFEYNYDKMT